MTSRKQGEVGSASAAWRDSVHCSLGCWQDDMNVTSPLSTIIFFIFGFFSPLACHQVHAHRREETRGIRRHPTFCLSIRLSSTETLTTSDVVTRRLLAVWDRAPSLFLPYPYVQFLARFYPPCHSRPVAEGSTEREEWRQTVGLWADRLITSRVCNCLFVSASSSSQRSSLSGRLSVCVCVREWANVVFSARDKFFLSVRECVISVLEINHVC